MSQYTVQTPNVHQLSAKALFEKLDLREKLYAHHLSCRRIEGVISAAWKGTRLILRQVSEESPLIFDFIRELVVQEHELTSILGYFATCLSNVGSYYGGQKFVPAFTSETLGIIAQRSTKANELYRQVASAIFQLPPHGLGFPSAHASSAYYPGKTLISQQEIAMVSEAPEYRGLQASTQQNVTTLSNVGHEWKGTVKLVGGDYHEELSAICDSLEQAMKFAADETQRATLSHYVQSFRTGSVDDYRESQCTWVKDRSPKVENIFGFVESYRDPQGARAEFEAIVAINDPERTKLLHTVVKQSDEFIRTLPWAREQSENNGKGHFEKDLLAPSDLSSIHTLVYNSSIIFDGINLPNFNDIRQDCGFKNVIVETSLTAPRSKAAFIDVASRDAFQRSENWAWYLWLIAHETLGHGSGKLLTETTPGEFNFESHHPPISPIDNQSIKIWYKPGQSWHGQFQGLAATVEECRAELVGICMMDNNKYLKLFGFDEKSDITAKSSILRATTACVKIIHTPASNDIHVQIDESTILTHAKPALENMLLRLHVYRCIADVHACRAYFGDLSGVSDEVLAWRDVAVKKKAAPLVFVQGNTCVEDGGVVVREYEASVRGVIRSWMERGV
ncbi:peptidase family M49-domain-containing protein [Paraphoma chrysanthemicola]|uniref:Peptidase family M49-domain-containing protein n=1 Tax=Paraphoma chrysanthemicola TaxID=798071 RepID=A0A8K0VZD0_9PLEO|nr:peptidase family M49-domain-containing protein [Paraphoma chrysanthemicola]